MSASNSKASYHPVSILPGSLSNGSNFGSFDSVEGRLPRLRKPGQNDDIYRSYQPKMPYDMMVLRDEQMYKTSYSKDFMTNDKTFVSSTIVVPPS